MFGADIRLDRAAKLRVYRTTCLITAMAIVLSVIITNVIMETFSAGVNLAGLSVAIVTPAALGGPALGLILFRQEQLRCANEQLRRMATYDWLTGCLNRGAFTALVSKALQSRKAISALLVVDVDHFKAINDSHGHDRGDDALKLIAQTLQQAAGENTPIGRLGGEEFGIFLRDASNGQAAQLAEKLRTAVSRLAFVTEGSGCPLSVSVGGATMRGPIKFQTFYKMADTCLYQAKAEGRDRVALFDAA